jgi:hypothetical protein
MSKKLLATTLRNREETGYPEARKVISDQRRPEVDDVITVQTDRGMAMNLPTKQGRRKMTMVETLGEYNKNPSSFKTKLYKNPHQALRNAERGTI